MTSSGAWLCGSLAPRPRAPLACKCCSQWRWGAPWSAGARVGRVEGGAFGQVQRNFQGLTARWVWLKDKEPEVPFCRFFEPQPYFCKPCALQLERWTDGPFLASARPANWLMAEMGAAGLALWGSSSTSTRRPRHAGLAEGQVPGRKREDGRILPAHFGLWTLAPVLFVVGFYKPWVETQSLTFRKPACTLRTRAVEATPTSG